MTSVLHNIERRAKACAFALFAMAAMVCQAQTVETGAETSQTQQGRGFNQSTSGMPKPTVPTAVVEPHNPNKALLLSALLPGAGQVYNHQAWKIPIIYAGMGGVGYLIHTNYTKMAMFKKEYIYRVNNNDTPQLDKYATYPTANIYNLYQSYNKDFQLYIIVEVAVYGLNLLDAYVFGHLFDFEINDDLSLQLYPALQCQQQTMLGMTPCLGISLQF